MDTVVFDESVYLLQSLKSSIIRASDPIDARTEGEKFSRIILVLGCFTTILNSGVIPVSRKADTDQIYQILDVQKLPIN